MREILGCMDFENLSKVLSDKRVIKGSKIRLGHAKATNRRFDKIVATPDVGSAS